MPSTHTSLHYHLVFSTKDRTPAIAEAWRATLHEYIGGCVRGLGGIPLQVGGVADHVHILAGLKATHCIADAVREVKKASTAWIREFNDRRFTWQEGYGAFTVSRHDVTTVDDYIRGQEKHHPAVDFRGEYLALLADYRVEYDPRYLW